MAPPDRLEEPALDVGSVPFISPGKAAGCASPVRGTYHPSLTKVTAPRVRKLVAKSIFSPEGDPLKVAMLKLNSPGPLCVYTNARHSAQALQRSAASCSAGYTASGGAWGGCYEAAN